MNVPSGTTLKNVDVVSAYLGHLAVRGLAAKTIVRRRSSLRAFERWVAPTAIAHAMGDDVWDWLARYSSPATRRAYLTDLRAFYRWATRRGLTATDPTADLDPIRVPANMPRPITREELQRAWGCADHRVRLILAFGALAGLRRAEIANLHGDDIGEGAIRVVGKGGKTRVVPLHPSLAPMLVGCGRGPLFPSPADPSRPVTPESLGRWVTEHFRALGIEGSTHRLRHRFASDLAAHADAYLVAQALGHAQLNAAMVYVQVSGVRLRDHVAALPEVI